MSFCGWVLLPMQNWNLSFFHVFFSGFVKSLILFANLLFFFVCFYFKFELNFFSSGSVKSLSLYLCELMFGYFSISILNLEMIDGFIF